jgi:aryl-alcohol dehydrogenase-like predicted oxidoreductase
VARRVSALRADLGLAEDEVAASALRFVLSHPAVTCVIPGMRLVHNWSATPP